MSSGVDRNGDDAIDGKATVLEIALEKSASVDVVFPPKQTVVMEFELVTPGTPVEQRPDLGIGRGDVRLTGDSVEITVHSLGHVATPVGYAVLEDAHGRELARAPLPAMDAPTDLVPRTTTVRLPRAGSASRVRIALEGEAEEVTRLNNRFELP